MVALIGNERKDYNSHLFINLVPGEVDWQGGIVDLAPIAYFTNVGSVIAFLSLLNVEYCVIATGMSWRDAEIIDGLQATRVRVKA